MRWGKWASTAFTAANPGDEEGGAAVDKLNAETEVDSIGPAVWTVISLDR